MASAVPSLRRGVGDARSRELRREESVAAERRPVMGAPVRIVLLPRYTGVYGTIPLYTPPINVRAYEKVIITAWKGNGIGDTPADVEFRLGQSTDLGIWNASGDFSPASPGAEVVHEEELLLEWARLGVEITGASPGTTVWAVGTFIPRVSEG
jgi:hypothetical protein